jgi:hypothetical protein
MHIPTKYMKELEKIINKFKYGRFEDSQGNIMQTYWCYRDELLDALSDWYKKKGKKKCSVSTVKRK